MSLVRTEKMVKRRFWPKLMAVLAAVPFAEDAVAAYMCAFDPATPLKAKGILLAALAYFILPLDAVPDMIAGLGFTDDMAVLLAALNVIRTNMTPDHRARAREKLAALRKGATG